jgi:hypothetical protein
LEFVLGEELLTAKSAKKIRKGRKEEQKQLLFATAFAGFSLRSLRIFFTFCG